MLCRFLCWTESDTLDVSDIVKAHVRTRPSRRALRDANSDATMLSKLVLGIPQMGSPIYYFLISSHLFHAPLCSVHTKQCSFFFC